MLQDKTVSSNGRVKKNMSIRCGIVGFKYSFITKNQYHYPPKFKLLNFHLPDSLLVICIVEMQLEYKFYIISYITFSINNE